MDAPGEHLVEEWKTPACARVLPCFTENAGNRNSRCYVHEESAQWERGNCTSFEGFLCVTPVGLSETGGPPTHVTEEPAGGYNTQLVTCYESMERQYASLPRQSDPQDYLSQSWGVQGDAAHFSGSRSGYLSYPSQDNYQPREPEQRPLQPRHGDFGKHLPPTQRRGPLRQDVPPSPPMPLRSTRYKSMNRGRLERFTYGEEQHQDPRQENIKAAV
ncbi:hypothetical protein Z043_110193 [Scleropages formosus]|uniref:Uncharacterized protein n=1 Tax=Scleropages formosus TaxID=113540 RepID=A0A0P7UNA4_SCLFO|nr:hypothetical protein Z043_110193 [Scleropages formosus]